jgi:hypothetical protein
LRAGERRHDLDKVCEVDVAGSDSAAPARRAARTSAFQRFPPTTSTRTLRVEAAIAISCSWVVQSPTILMPARASASRRARRAARRDPSPAAWPGRQGRNRPPEDRSAQFRSNGRLAGLDPPI